MKQSSEIGTWEGLSELRTDQLDLAYEERTVFQDLNLDIPIGKITALVGPNGSGKSTILKTLSRLLRPRKGRVILDGTPIRQLPTKLVARRLAILPQNPAAPEGLTVERLVWHGRYPHQGFLGTSTSEDAAAVAWALEQAGLESFAVRPLEALSGGERQRAWIAMALAQQTPLVLLDEPTTFLDIGHQLEVMELLRELNQSHGLTVVIVLHDLNQAARYSDHMIVVHDGRVWREGRPEEVLDAELLYHVFGVQGDVHIDPEFQKPYFLPRHRVQST